MDFGAKFDQGLSYEAFLAQYGSDEHRRRWSAVHDRVKLSEEQLELLQSFRRELKVICMAGTWCGDCVEQCPIFDHFSAATGSIQLRFFDRDDHGDLQTELTICGGARVPSVVFLSEDGQFVGRYGDRTLSKYRQMVADQLGAACPTGLVTEDSLLQSVVQDWLDEFERVQWILRTSPRLRERHGD